MEESEGKGKREEGIGRRERGGREIKKGRQRGIQTNIISYLATALGNGRSRDFSEV